MTRFRSIALLLAALGGSIPAHGESLFPANKTGGDSGPENTFYELGTIFRSDVPGFVTHLRVYSLATDSGPHIARIWKNSSNSLVGGPYTWTYGGTAGWVTMDIPDVHLDAATDYTVVVSTCGGGVNYPFIAGDLATAGGNGLNLTYPASAGVFTTTQAARPTHSFNGANYLRDVVFSAEPTEPPTNGPVQISEFLADNKSGLQDEDGDFSDWIEIYNPTASPIDLSGYQLLDSSATWTFPAVTLGAQRHLVIFSSGKNRALDPEHLHTNFKLSADGEFLALKNAGGTVISEFSPAFPAQRTDISYGRNTAGVTGYYATPTPGSFNGISFVGFVADTAVTVGRGFYNSAQMVAISCPTAGAAIRYTLDGSTPTATTGTPYTAPFTIGTTSTLRVGAFLADHRPSRVDTHTYVFLSDVLQQSTTTAQAYGWPAGPVNGQEFRFGMKPALTTQYTLPQMTDALRQIPTMSVVTDQANLTNPTTGIYVNPTGDGPAWERPVSIELLNPDGSPGFQENCGLRIRGGQSRSTSFPKHSFHVNFRSEYGAGKLKFPLFGSSGASEFDTFDLRCEHGYAYADPAGGTYGTEFTAMRDVFCRDLSGVSGYATTRSKYYHLFLNGQYWGLYQTQERPEEDYGETYLGGLKEEYDVVKATGLPQLTIENSAGTYAAWTQLWNACRGVSAIPQTVDYFSLLGKNPDGTPNAALPVLLNPRELAGYMLLHYYCGHSDEPLSVSFNFEKPNNFRAMRRRGLTEPFHFFVHDAESSMLAPEWVDNRANAVNLTSGNRAMFQFSNPEWMHEDLLASPEYRITFADEAQRLLFNGGAFTEAVAKPLWDARSAQINQAVIGESIRWGASSNHNQATWAAKVASIRSQFFATRSATVIAQLRQRNLFPSVNAPAFSNRGGQVAANFVLTLTAQSPNGQIRYTTDGTDPRAIGGGVSASAGGSASSYNVTITTSTKVRVRFLSNAGEWSAIDEASFVIAQPATAADLVVSELHYNAPSLTPAETTAGFTSGNQFEFVELMNISNSDRDLSAVRFNNGITFDFATANAAAKIIPPGGRVVVVGNVAAFNARLAPGSSPVIAGVYSGNLDNSGESISIIGAGNAVIKVFTYDDVAPWPVDADGLGRSLVLNNPLTNPNHNLPTSWRPSAAVNGSPGMTKSTNAPLDPSGDSDGNGFNNLIEYASGPSPQMTIAYEPFTPPAGVTERYAYFRFPRSLNADGVTYLPEISDNLSSWSPVGLVFVGMNVTSGPMATVTYRSAQPLSSSGLRWFARLRVVK